MHSSTKYFVCAILSAAGLSACGAKSGLLVEEAAIIDAGTDASDLPDVPSCGLGAPLTSVPNCEDPAFWAAEPSLCYEGSRCQSCVSSSRQFMGPDCVIPLTGDMESATLICVETVDSMGTHYRAITRSEPLADGLSARPSEALRVSGHQSPNARVRIRGVFASARGFDFSETMQTYSPLFADWRRLDDSTATQIALNSARSSSIQVSHGGETVPATRPQGLVATSSIAVQWVERTDAGASIVTWQLRAPATRVALPTRDTPRLFHFAEPDVGYGMWEGVSAWTYDNMLEWSDGRLIVLPSRPEDAVIAHLGPGPFDLAPLGTNLAFISIHEGSLHITTRDGEAFDVGVNASRVLRTSFGAWFVQEGVLFSLNMNEAGELLVGERSRPLLVDEAELLVVMDDGRQLSRSELALPDNVFGLSRVRLSELFEGEVVDLACAPDPNSNLRCAFLVRRGAELGVVNWDGPGPDDCGF